jgi:hypothetical protein
MFLQDESLMLVRFMQRNVDWTLDDKSQRYPASGLQASSQGLLDSVLSNSAQRSNSEGETAIRRKQSEHLSPQFPLFALFFGNTYPGSQRTLTLTPT